MLILLLLFLLIIPVASAASVVVAVVDPQRPSHNLVLVQVAHSGGRLIHIGVFEEAEPFWSACLLIVDEAEINDGASSGEEFAYLLFTNAWRSLACRALILGMSSIGLTIRNVADEDDFAALLARPLHVRYVIVLNSWWREGRSSAFSAFAPVPRCD